MMSLIPTLNKAYSMVIDHESQRSIANVLSMVIDSLEVATLFSQKRGSSSNCKSKGVIIGTQTR